MCGLRGVTSFERLATQDAADAHERNRLQGTTTTTPGVQTVKNVTMHSNSRITRHALNAMDVASAVTFHICAEHTVRGKASFSAKGTFTDKDATNSFVDNNTHLYHVQFRH